MSDKRIFHMNSGNDDLQAVLFLRRIKPASYSMHFEGNRSVVLLKPTDRGGTTMGRILIHGDAADDAFDRAWAQYKHPAG